MFDFNMYVSSLEKTLSLDQTCETNEHGWGTHASNGCSKKYSPRPTCPCMAILDKPLVIFLFKIFNNTSILKVRQ